MTSLTADARRGKSALLGAMDRWLLRVAERRKARPVDRVLVLASDAADYSVLWLVLAAAMAAGGPGGKRAAKHGLLALGFASATVNGPLKLLLRRRPPVQRRAIRRKPRTSSFPSGHAASAFAFATAATRELPQAAPLLIPLAGAVAYSRVYLGVHYPSDVLAGAVVGAVAGLAARPVARRVGIDAEVRSKPQPERPLASEAVFVTSPRAARSRRLAEALRAVEEQGVTVAEELDIDDVGRLPQVLRSADGAPRLVVAAGGDGTVGSVAACLAGLDNLLAILPLGTANDFARSLDIPMRPRRAASLLARGRIGMFDLGRVTRSGEPLRYFAHAATTGLNVTFASLATRPSMRARLGRLTYLAAARYAASQRSSFKCALRHDATVEELTLLELSVINAPIFGGPLELSVPGSAANDGTLVVLAIEEMPLGRLLRAGLFLALGVERPVRGVHAMRVTDVGVESQSVLKLALDGEVNCALPAEIDVAAGSLRVITPRT